jgi:ABC-type sugar transport system ATPase subunit
MLEIRDIDVPAAEDSSVCLIEKLSLTVTKRQMVLLHGPSGCGKTMLLRTVVGLINPIGGAVRLRVPDEGETNRLA